MRVILAHRIALDPTPSQAQDLARACGVARAAWNWALDEWNRQRQVGTKPNEAAIRRLLNSIKRAEFPWMLDAPKSVAQQAIKNLGRAWANRFEGRARTPRFKKRGRHDSARFDNGPGTFEVAGQRIRLPKLGWLKMREALRFDGRPISATVSRTADRWFVSIQVEVQRGAPVRENQAAVGVDLGISSAVVLSTGEKIDAPKPLKRNLGALRRAGRRVSRKPKGSMNRRKAVHKLARVHARVANIRNDWTHKTTTDLVRRFSVIGIEDLHVRGMVKNHCLARAISDVGFAETRRQLEYKAPMHGARVVVVDRWFPSSKTCSRCGVVADAMPLSVREWTCAACGACHDRDVNAAENLRQQALAATASCAGSYACGEWSSADTTSVQPLDEAGNHAQTFVYA